MSIEVDINNVNLWDEEVQYDPDAELNPTILPPEGKWLLARFKVGRRGIDDKPRKATNGQPFFMAHIQGNIQAPGERYDNSAVFDQASSIVFAGGTSRIHAFLKAVGQPAPSRCSLGELRQRVIDALATEPTAYVRGRWTASMATGTDPDTGKAIYEDVLKGMRRFPQLPDGSFNPVAEVNGERVTAQFDVLDYSKEG